MELGARAAELHGAQLHIASETAPHHSEGGRSKFATLECILIK